MKEKKENCGDLTPYRDTLESQLFKEVYALNKPILGICRGHQLLNVLCGGKIVSGLTIRISKYYNSQNANHLMTISSIQLLL